MGRWQIDLNFTTNRISSIWLIYISLEPVSEVITKEMDEKPILTNL